MADDKNKDKDKKKGDDGKREPAKVLVLLDGVQYTNQQAVDRVKGVLDMHGVEYKEVKALKRG